MVNLIFSKIVQSYLIFKPFPNLFPTRFFTVHKYSNPVYSSRQICHPHKCKYKHTNGKGKFPHWHPIRYAGHHHHWRCERYYRSPERECTVGILESMQHKEKSHNEGHCDWKDELLGVGLIVYGSTNCCKHA